MARPFSLSGGNPEFQLKAVERGYPLYGSIELKDGLTLADALAEKDGVCGAVVEESALRRMNMAVGDRVQVGEVTVEVRGIINREPDRGLNAFARPRARRLMIPLRGGVGVGAGAARQPVRTSNIACACRRASPTSPSSTASEAASPRRRLAGEGARRGGRRHPLLARPADAVHRPDRAVLAAGRRGGRRQRHLELPGGPAAHHRHAEVPGRARTPGLLDLSPPALGLGSGRRGVGPGDRRRPAVRRPVGDRRRPAGAGARGALRLAAHHRGGVRPAGLAAVRPDAIVAGPPRLRGHADRRGASSRAVVWSGAMRS